MNNDFWYGVLVGIIIGAIILPLLLGGNNEPPKEQAVPNYLEPEPELLDWMRGNRRELTLHRLASFRTFKLKNFVTPHLLTDPEWRRAKRELMDANVLEIKRGTVARLTQAGAVWVDEQLYGKGNKQTNATNGNSGAGGVNRSQ